MIYAKNMQKRLQENNLAPDERKEPTEEVKKEVQEPPTEGTQSRGTKRPLDLSALKASAPDELEEAQGKDEGGFNLPQIELKVSGEEEDRSAAKK